MKRAIELVFPGLVLAGIMLLHFSPFPFANMLGTLTLVAGFTGLLVRYC